MNKAEVLENIKTERAHFESLLAPLSEEQMCQAVLEGHWSIKDILAHIVVWEQRCLGWIESSLHGGTPAIPEPGATWADLDRLNERDFLSNQNRPLQDVLADFHRSYQQFLEQIEALSEEDITVPQRFSWMHGESLIPAIAANSYDHYNEHGEQIYAWLANEQLQA